MEWRRVLEQPSITAEQLRSAFRAALEASGRFASVAEASDDPYVLELCTRGGQEARSDVHRLYHELSRMSPGERLRRFDDHLAASLEAARAAEGELPAPTPDQLVPTIKSLAWIGGLPIRNVATAPLVADLWVVYAWDRPSTLTFATVAELEQLALSPDAAYALAVDNLRRRLPNELATRGDGRSSLFAAGGNVEASLLLVPEIWDNLAHQLSGEIVTCAAARDVLLVTATGIAGGVESLLAARARIVDALTPSERISTTLLVRRGGAWQMFERN